MITLNASGGSITFEFSGNSTYLNDGTITVPVNSLALIIDESDMATFKKAASNDIFVSANIAEFGMTKDELESWFKENAVGSTGGGGGITSGEVQTMIDESVSGKADSSAVTAEISAAVSGKADTSYVDSAVSGKVDTNTYNTYTAATDSRLAEDEEVTAAALVNLNEALGGKLDTSAITTTITSASTDSEIPTAKAVYDALGDGITSGEVQTMIDESISGKADTSSLATVATSGSYNDLTNKPTIPTSTSAVTSGSTDVLTSGGAYEQFGGLKLVKLTESEYAALVSKDANTLYVVIPDPSNP